MSKADDIRMAAGSDSDLAEADYSRSADGQTAERVDARRRRRARERLMALLAASSEKHPVQSTPAGVFVSDVADIASDSEDDRMSSGTSLAIGSSSRRAYVEARLGMDFIDMRRAALARDGFGTKGNLTEPDVDEDRVEYDEKLATADDALEASNEAVSREGRKARDRSQAYRIIKEDEIDSIMNKAWSMVGATDTKADDKVLSKDLSDLVEAAVSDTGEQDLVDEAAELFEDLTDVAEAAR